MLYLNILLSILLSLPFDLTLTRVVFEYERLKSLETAIQNLTLTSVYLILINLLIF